MKRCPFCGTHMDEALVACEHCGRDLRALESDPAVLERFRELRAGLRAGRCGRIYQVRNPEPTAFEVWTRPTGVCVPLLAALLLLGVLPGIVYIVVKVNERARPAFRIEIRGRRIFRDDRDITRSAWLRARLAHP